MIHQPLTELGFGAIDLEFISQISLNYIVKA